MTRLTILINRPHLTTISLLPKVKIYSVSSSIPTSPVKINKIYIYDSPILAVLSSNKKTIYLLLDTGATASLITKEKSDELNLVFVPTVHTAV
jgi:hypothetical protein